MIEFKYRNITALERLSKSFYYLKKAAFLLKMQIGQKQFSNLNFSKNNIGLKYTPMSQVSSPKNIFDEKTSYKIFDFSKKCIFWNKSRKEHGPYSIVKFCRWVYVFKNLILQMFIVMSEKTFEYIDRVYCSER